MAKDRNPSNDPSRGAAVDERGRPAGASRSLEILKTRADFLAAARARRTRAPGLALQARRRKGGTQSIRVGFTCSKKVGNAVARNRAKRRLREVARQVLPQAGRPGWDYVLIGLREATAQRPFVDLMDDLSRALEKVHGT